MEASAGAGSLSGVAAGSGHASVPSGGAMFGMKRNEEVAMIVLNSWKKTILNSTAREAGVGGAREGAAGRYCLGEGQLCGMASATVGAVARVGAPTRPVQECGVGSGARGLQCGGARRRTEELL